MAHRIDPARVEEAARAIDPVFTGSPQLRAEDLGAAVGCDVVLKVETVNPIRSFKGRGTDLLVRESQDAAVACASAGNFGQGLAYAGRTHGRAVHVFTAASANPMKVARMRALGATVHQVADDFDAAKDAAEAEAARHGWRLVVDGREPEIAAGAATMALELGAGPWTLDHVLVPVGNGSLICGIGSWVKATSPGTEVVAVGPAGAPAMERAWRTGDMAPGGPTATIADGLAARVPVPEALELMREVVDRFVLVDDELLLRAMRLLVERAGILSEPSGAAGLAGLLALGEELRGRTVAVPVCGSNVTPADLARALAV